MAPIYTESQLKELELLLPNEEYLASFFGTSIKYLSRHLGIRKIVDENNRFTLDLVIDSETTFDEIERSYKEILEIRKKVIQVQGHDFCDYLTELIWQLEEGRNVKPQQRLDKNAFLKLMETKNYTLKDLTLDINFDSLLFFLGSMNPKNEERFREFSKQLFYELIGLFPTKKGLANEADEFYLERKMSWKNGTIPCDISVDPIPPFRVRERIRFIRNTRYTFGINNFSEGSRRRVKQMYLLYVKSRDWQEAGKFLERNSPKIFEYYSPRLDWRLKSILEYPFA